MHEDPYKQKNNRYDGCEIRTFKLFQYSTNTAKSIMNLNKQQAEAVEWGTGPLLIIAGAGSGKTKTLTSRLEKLLKEGVPPERIIAITFTNKAAEEMAKRIAHSAPVEKSNARFAIRTTPFIGTFHSFGARLLRKEASKLGRTTGFSIFDDDESLSVLKKIIKTMKADGLDPPSPALLLRRVYSTKNNLSSLDEEPDPRARAALIRYEKLLKEQNAFDFGDLIEKPVVLMRENREARERYENITDYILVDEYQDVNPAQYELIKLLAGKHRNLSVVGDDAQAIYGWRDANVAHFLRFSDDWPNVHVVKLEQNYRSTKNIIAGATGVIQENAFQHPKELWTENHAGNLIKIVATKDASQEADYITETIRAERKEGIQNTAILYRTNAQSRALEQALITSNIPYRIFGGVKFYERKEVKDLLAALRIAFNPKDIVSSDRLDAALGKRAALPIREELIKRGSSGNHLDLINFFINEARYFALLKHEYINAEERIENINELIVFAATFNSLQEFLERAALLQSTDTFDKSNAQMPNSPVQLMTIHMAKGLEFDRVFVAGACEGVLPHQMSYGTSEELEEERRLMYVAMTRAKENLTLVSYKIPSRFLYEIPSELTEFTSLSGTMHALPEDDIVYLDE